MITRALLIVFGSFVITVAPSLSQTKNKIIEWSRSPIGSNRENVEPTLQLFRQIDDVQIEDILVHGKAINIGEAFEGQDDWLKTITVRVKNLSHQRLVTVQLTLVLPQLGPGSPDVVFCYGCAKDEKERSISPGEVVELKMLGGDYYDFILSRIAEKNTLSEINKAQISHAYVTPPSGPVWFSGCVKTANPKSRCPYTSK